jgi:hypothetical protein
MGVKVKIVLRRRVLNPDRLVLEDSSKQSFALLADNFFAIGENNLI